MERYRVIREAIEAFGFVEIDGVQSVESAEQLTSTLGPIRALNGQSIQTLKPSSRELARSPSFSRHFGHDRFPLHTDTSFWRVPARYVVSYMSDASSVDTVVLPSSATRELLLRHKCLNPIFARNTVSGINYSAPWFGQNSDFIVFDPCYMKPANKAAALFCDAVEEYFDRSTRITWRGSKMIIIDNWRVLHGRQAAGEESRALLRFYRGS